MDWAEFFHMGGYAVFVWSSYGLTTFVIVANIVASLRRNKKIRTDIRRMIRREQDV